MENQIEKSAERIKEQIEFWFLNYFNKSKVEFNGTEVFTLFELIDLEVQVKIKHKLNLKSNEIPVLILKISDVEFIINTTSKFIRVSKSSIEFIDYSDFEWHKGYKSILADKLPSGKPISIKTDGYLSEFGLKTKNGKIIYWKIPTGVPGFGFWNVTKKVELIGRRYNVIQ